MGCFYHYSSVSAKYFAFKTNSEMGVRNFFYNNISANINYHFLTPGRWDLYSGISAGYTLILRRDNDVKEKIKLKNLSEFFLQINGIGCRWILANHFAVYGEIGYGWNGIFMGWISYFF